MSNILILTDKLTMGGAENYFCILANHLSTEDMNVYAAAGPGELFNKIENKQKFISMSRNNHIANLLKLRKSIKKLNIHVVHANSLRMLFYAVVLKQVVKRQLSIVYTKHNVTLLENKAPFLFKKTLNNFVDKIITVSDFEKENLVQFGVQKELMQTVYNGVDLEHYSFHVKEKRKEFHVGILARLSAEKNHSLFIQIANEFKDYDQVTFHIAGDGPERSSIEKMITELGLQQKVLLHGNVENPYPFICKMDVMVLTSYREVFPMVVIEAMAAGTPIVSIDVGGIKEAISSGITGILIPSNFKKEIVEQINLLLKDWDLRKKIGYNARRKVEQSFSLNQMIKSTSEQYMLVKERG